MKTHCPHCQSLAKQLRSRQVTPVYREVTYMCNNQECGHIFLAGVGIVRTIMPSKIPNPDIQIPVSAHAHLPAAKPGVQP